MKAAIRPWCAVARFPGKEKFLAGTIVMPADAQAPEIDRALREHFLRFLPDGFEVIQPVAGALFFQPEGESP